MPLRPDRTIDELEELRALTGDENGAQRVAWTETWETARGWLRSTLAGTGAEETIDAAGNQWFTLKGASDRALVLGGHLDSVPNGGWLDGCAERRRRGRGAAPDRRGRSAAPDGAARQLGRRGGRPLRPVALRLVGRRRLDARPGRAAEPRRTATGSRFPTRCASTGWSSTVRSTARAELEHAAAYLELHIEQGPVLESLDLPLGVVLGTFGVERSRITWRGQAAHAGSTPMDQRRDALAGAAKLALSIREIAREVAAARCARPAAS